MFTRDRNQNTWTRNWHSPLRTAPEFPNPLPGRGGIGQSAVAADGRTRHLDLLRPTCNSGVRGLLRRCHPAGGFRQFIEDTLAAGRTLRAVRAVTTPNR
jgi:hypothetical protein